jgi:aspartate kinase
LSPTTDNTPGQTSPTDGPGHREGGDTLDDGGFLEDAPAGEPPADHPVSLTAAEDAFGQTVAVIEDVQDQPPRTPTIVMKFGGTSVADAECIKRVARRIVEGYEAGHPVVAVVSARGDTTDELISLANEISDDPPEREMDMLLSTGERISAALVAMAIHDLGYDAISLTGSQAGIMTDEAHTRAKILDIKPFRVQQALDAGKIVLVAGFQGVSTAQEVTTLGRGGSDTTAVALAAALGAEVCEIYTDVDGVYTTDPRVVPAARKLPEISYEEMLEMAASGAKVLMLRCVEFARRYGVAIHVRSSFSDVEGTWIRHQEEDVMEQAIVSGVTYTLEDCKVTVHRLPDKPGVAARVFKGLAKQGVNVDMIIQNVSEGGTTDISFTAGAEDMDAAIALLEELRDELQFERLETDTNMAKVSLVGAGMKTHPGVAAKMFEVLAEHCINIEMISTSSIKISCVIEKQYTELAVRALHEAFQLDKGTIEREEIFT